MVANDDRAAERAYDLHALVRAGVVADDVAGAQEVGHALGAAVVENDVQRVEKGTAVSGTEDRDKLWAVQTPQAFHFKILANAYKNLGKNDVTDDCQAVELSGETVRIYENRAPNFKITTVEYLQIASALLVK